MGTGALPPEAKQAGGEADHSPPSSAKIKNSGAVPPLCHTSSWWGAQLIKHKDIFTFFFFTLEHYSELFQMQ
jgi:hypothetical protein